MDMTKLAPSGGSVRVKYSEPKIKIYLAGKIRKGNDWRSQLCHKGYSYHYSIPTFIYKWYPQDGVLVTGDTLTGPFPFSCDHGCYHGQSLHAWAKEGNCAETDDPDAIEDIREDVALMSQQAIEDSELVFAFIDQPDCYGAIAELGYELGYAAAKNKAIYVAFDSTLEKYDDMWFIQQLTSGVFWNCGSDALAPFIISVNEYKCFAYLKW